MKKVFFNSLIALAVILFSSYNVFHIQKTNELSEIAKANIQVLATIEQLDNGEVGNGICASYSDYSQSSQTQTRQQIYVHYSSGLDIVRTYDIVECSASGRGTLWGANGIKSQSLVNSEFVPCTNLCKQPQ